MIATQTTASAQAAQPNPTRSLPKMLLHIEGLAVLAAAVTIYGRYAGTGWWVFFLLLLAPDVAMLPYLVSKRAGTIAYNLVHTYTGPLLVGVIALVTGWELGVALALIWLAHCGIDRAVGYGLKYSTEFKDTHLGRL